MKRGPSGKVVCCICKKWLPKDEAVGLNSRWVHVTDCFGQALKRIGKALKVVDVYSLAAETAYKLGLQHGQVLRDEK